MVHTVRNTAIHFKVYVNIDTIFHLEWSVENVSIKCVSKIKCSQRVSKTFSIF